MRPMSFRAIEGGRSLPAYEPPRPRERETIPLRPLLVGAALGVPMWFGLYAVAAWAHGVVSGWGR